MGCASSTPDVSVEQPKTASDSELVRADTVQKPDYRAAPQMVRERASLDGDTIEGVKARILTETAEFAKARVRAKAAAAQAKTTSFFALPVVRAAAVAAGKAASVACEARGKSEAFLSQYTAAAANLDLARHIAAEYTACMKLNQREGTSCMPAAVEDVKGLQQQANAARQDAAKHAAAAQAAARPVEQQVSDVLAEKEDVLGWNTALSATLRPCLEVDESQEQHVGISRELVGLHNDVHAVQAIAHSALTAPDYVELCHHNRAATDAAQKAADDWNRTMSIQKEITDAMMACVKLAETQRKK